jgi:hypothetical protein
MEDLLTEQPKKILHSFKNYTTLAVLHHITRRDVKALRASATRGAENTDGLNRYK